MAYVICQHPAVRINLTFEKEFWPKVVSIIERCEGKYEEEIHIHENSGRKEFIMLKGVTALHNWQVGEILGLYYSLEFQAEDKTPENHKFYISVTIRKKAKKDVRENRKEIHSGSQGRAAGESSGNHQHGQDYGPGGISPDGAVVRPDDLRELERAEAADDDCD